MMYAYKTLSGHTFVLDLPVDLVAFLRKLEDLAAKPRTKSVELLALVYSAENPILNHDLVPGRAIVTKDALEHPAYTIMTDIIWRKEVEERGDDVEELASHYTLTVADVAEKRGVSSGAIRQAIAVGRIASWVKDGQHFIDPRSLETFNVAPRGPASGGRPRGPGVNPVQRAGVNAGARKGINAARQGGPGPRPGTPELPRSPERLEGRGAALEVKKGHEGIFTLKVAGLKFAKGVDVARFEAWNQALVLTAIGGKMRAFRIAQGTNHSPNEEIRVGNFYVRGGFRVIEKFNNSERAKEAFEEAK